MTRHGVQYHIRPATPDDVPFLWTMLYEAAYPIPEIRPPPPFEQFQADGFHDRYLSDWGRHGDGGVIADAAGEPLGAAWFRLFAADRSGHAFLGTDVPELSIAVRPDYRGQGIGAALLNALVREATVRGFPALSLSVANANRAQALYERQGFVKLSLDEGSWTMRRDLAP